MIVKDILYLTAVLNSCMNPIIYGVEKENENSTKNFKDILKKVYHFSERSRLTRYASTNTTRIHFSSRQKTQRLQNCEFANLQTKCKSAKIAKITKMATKYNNHKKGANAKVFNCLLLQAAPDPVPQRKQ